MSLIIDGSSGITFPDSSKISNTKSLFSTGNTASRPSNPTLGTLYYNTERDALENYTSQGWLKVSVPIPTISSISGTIYSNNTSTLTLTGSNFGSGQGIVTFTSGGTIATANATPASSQSLSVLTPASIYGLSVGTLVNITFTNSDGGLSGAIASTIIGLPTGGTITTSGNTRIHSFTSSNTFVVPSGFSANANYLVVAGGGGGGGWGGGGGAGGVITGFTSVTPQSYNITIGAGGARGTISYTAGGDGGNSSVLGVAVAVGGGGGGFHDAQPGRSGGSGGGGGMSSTPGNNSAGGSGTSGQGFSGGVGSGIVDSWNSNRGGGGGGASQVGYTGVVATAGSTNAGRGGDGVTSTIGGTSTTYAGGGGGHGGYTPGRSIGGAGGGGAGGRYTAIGGDDGTVNTGGGGGGAYGSSPSELCGLGGSGIVIISYQLS